MLVVTAASEWVVTRQGWVDTQQQQQQPPDCVVSTVSDKSQVLSQADNKVLSIYDSTHCLTCSGAGAATVHCTLSRLQGSWYY